jgi:hypothetical protein
MTRHWLFFSPSEGTPAGSVGIHLSISAFNGNGVAGFATTKTFPSVEELMSAMKLLPYSPIELTAIEGQMRAKFQRIDNLELSKAHFKALGLYHDYKEEVTPLCPVAVKLGQNNVHAPGHSSWGTVACDRCKDVFSMGQNYIFGSRISDKEAVSRLEEILAQDHAMGQLHHDYYEIADW